MKRLLFSLFATLLLFATVSVQAQKYHVVELVDKPQAGVNYVLMNVTETTDPYAGAVNGMQHSLADDNVIWQLESTGEKSDDNYDLYVLKSVGKNAYWQEDDFEGNLGLDGYDMHSYAGTNANWGAKATACRFTVLRAGSVGHKWRDQGGSGGYILARNKAVQQSDGSYYYYKLGVQLYNIAFEPWNENVAWNFYTVAENAEKDKLQELVDNITNSGITYEANDNPGGYSTDKVAAYNATLEAAIIGLADNLTDAEYVALYNNLVAAHNDLEQSMNPVVEGYYFVVSGYSAFYEQQGVKKALYAFSSTEPRWGSFDESTTIADKDYSFLWHITPYNDGWKLTSVAYGTDYDGPTYNTGQSSQCYLVNNSNRTVYINPIGNQNFRIYTSANQYSMHANGYSSGAGVGNNIVTWNTSGDGASAWRLQTVTDQDYIDAALAYGAQAQLREELTSLLSEASRLYDKLFVVDVDLTKPMVTKADDNAAVGDEANQFLYNRKETSEGRYAALIDGNIVAHWNANGEDTGNPTNYGSDGQWAYFHGSWSGGVINVGAHSSDTKDFMQVDLSATPVSSFVLRTAPRYNNTNAQPTQYTIYATNDTTGFYAGTDTWTRITTLTVPTLARETYYTSPLIELGASYKYVRFLIEQTNNNVRYAAWSEFNLYPGTISQTLSQYYYIAGMQDAADAMKDAENAGRSAVDNKSVTQDDIDNLASAIEAVKALFVDTTIISNVITNAEAEIAAATVGTAFGNIKTQATIDAYKAAVATAKTVNLKSAVSEEEAHSALDAVETARNAFLGDMIVPEAGKWYFITNQCPADAVGRTIDDTEIYTGASTYTHGSVLYVDPAYSNTHPIRWTQNENGEVAELATAMWRFIPVEGDTPNVFYIQNMASGQYIGAIPDRNNIPIMTSATPVEYQIGFIGGDNVVLSAPNTDEQYGYVHARTAYTDIVRWTNNASASQWTFKEVDEELEGVVLNLQHPYGGQFVTLAFPVEELSSINEGVSFYAIKNMTLNEDSTTTIGLYEKDSFAAGEPFIAIADGTNETGQILVYIPAADVALATTAVAGNGIVGTLESATASAGIADFVAGNDSTFNVLQATATNSIVNAMSGYLDATTFIAPVEGIETAKTITLSSLNWTKNNVEPKDTTKTDTTTIITKPKFSLAGADISVSIGAQVELPIVLTNVADISDLQFDLYLPTGVSVATDEDGESLISVSDDRTSTSKHQIYSLAQPDSAVRVMCVSPTGNTFTGDSGKVVVITLNVDATVFAGDYEITLKKVVVSNADRTYHLPNATSLLSVEAYTLGDINNDGEINVGDLSKLINMVLTNYTTVDNTFLVADVNKDGELNVGDYSTLVSLILTSTYFAQSKAFSTTSSNPNYPMTTAELQAEPLTIAAGQEKTVAVSLKNNGQDFNALQFDVLLPEGLTLVSDQATTTSRTRGFSVAASDSRVVMFNAMNAAISGTEGTILYLTLKADNTLAEGSYELEFSNITLADMNSNPVKAPAFISTVIVDDLTGIAGITSANGLNVENNANGLVLTSDRNQTVRIYSAAGALVKTVNLKSGQSKTITLVPGVYVINNVKTTVR